MKSSSKKKLMAVGSAAALGVLALLAGAVYFVGSPEFEDLAADYVVRAIESRTGSRASMERFDIDFWGQTITLDGLELRGGELASARPMLRVDRVEIGFRLRSLLQQRINLWALRIIRPEIYLTIGEEGRTNLPRPAERSGSGWSVPLDVEIGDLAVVDGALWVNESRVEVDFELAEVAGLFGYDEAMGILSGDLGYSGTIEGASREVIPYRLETTFDYAAGAVALRPAVITSGATELTLDGRIEEAASSSRVGELTYSGLVDIRFLNYFLPDTRLEGLSGVEGRLRFSSTEFSTVGHAASDRVMVDEWIATNFETDFTYRFPERVVEATRLDSLFAGGRVNGAVVIRPLPGTPLIEPDVVFDGIDPADFGRFFPWGVEYVRSGNASGSLAGWLDGGLGDYDLRGQLVLGPSEEPDAAEPIVGQTGFHWTPAGIEVSGLEARLGQTSLAAAGFAGPDRLAIDAEFESNDLTDLAFLYPDARGTGRFSGRVSGSFGEPVLFGEYSIDLGATRGDASGRVSARDLALETRVTSNDLRDLAFLWEDANGSGHFAGNVSGSVDDLQADGEFGLADFAWRDWLFGRIEGSASISGSRLELSDVLVTEGDSEVRVAGSYDLDGLSRPSLDVAIARLDVRRLASFDLPPIGGTVTGRAHVTGIDPLEFSGPIEISGLVFEDHSLGQASADVTYGPDLVGLSDAELRLEGARASGTMAYDRPQEQFDIDATVSGYRLDQLYWLGIPDFLHAFVREGSFRVHGTRDDPNVEGRVILEDFSFGRQSFPAATLDIRSQGRQVHATVETDERLDLEVNVDTSQDGLPLDGTAAFRAFDVGTFAGLQSGSIVATGNVTFGGSLADLGSLEGRGNVNALTASLAEQDLEVSRPFSFEFDTHRVTVSLVRLIGGDFTSVELGGTIAIEPGAPLDLDVYGPIDLSVLRSRYPGLDVSGTVLLDAWIEGTVSDPELGGTATLSNVAVGHESVFVGLSNLNGDIFLDGPRATLINIRGTMGGGRVVLSGGVGIGGVAEGAIDIRADASNVRVRTLNGLRTVFDGTFGLRGTLGTPALEGNVQLQSLSFDESFDEFLALFDRGPETAPEDGPLQAMSLAVHVEGDRNIRVNNELATIESRVDLDVGGTFSRPSLTGHAEISRGTLVLQNRRYRVTRGNVDFVDPVGIEPRIDIQAEAEVRDYRIILLITGRGEDIQLTMRSDPALPQLEIVSLIAGGRTREELAAEANVGDTLASEEALFQGAASNILADMLQSRVGSRLGVLNSVRIDPFLVGSENSGNPVARLTISEQITSDLEITYSQDLSSNSQQIIQIEYFLNGDTSFVASRDEAGRLGLDVKLRKRFD